MRDRPSAARLRSRSRAPARMSWDRSFRGVAMRSLIDREVARDGRALADDRIDAHLASMQFDERAHQRRAGAGAALPGAVGMTLEPVEYLILDIRRNSGP